MKTYINKPMWRQRAAALERQSLLLFGSLLLATPAAVQAQFTYTVTDGTVTITGYFGTGGAVSIPSQINNLPVIAIAGYAFEWDFNLTSVTIPNSVVSIGNIAFFDCYNLTNVTIPNSVTNIGSDAFGDTSLTNVTIPNSVVSIGLGAFLNCSSLTAITVDSANSNYSSIGGVLFDKGQTTLIQYPAAKAGVSYAIPETVTNIGDYALYECTSLTDVTIPESVCSIGDVAFAYCSSLTNVILPNNVTNIGHDAFNECTSLSRVTIPNGVTTIEIFTFSHCSSLTNVTIPNSVTSIGAEAFWACSGLTSVTIPNRVTNIGYEAFSGCTSLTSLTIPNSVTGIGDGAFSECSGLTNVTIPNSVVSIGLGAFLNCSSLTAITVDSANPNYSSIGGVLFDKGQTKLIQYPAAKVGVSYAIPETVTNIGPDAFGGCTSLTSVTIPTSVTFIGPLAFSSCSSLATVFFVGNAPYAGFLDSAPWPSLPFSGDNALAFYLPGTTGWGSTFGGIPTALWSLPYPLILNGSLGVGSNQFGFTVSWATNLSVVVEAASDLGNPAWSPLVTNALTGGTFNFIDPHWTNYPSRFYRLRWP